jgi:protein-S-isoprenylcysteine O-methyltransferase Ste14
MDTTSRPNRIPWPPIIYVVAAAIAVVLHWQLPLAWPQGAAMLLLAATGLCLICAAIALDIVTFFAFRRNRTTIMPNRGATALITDGPFAKTRNPIYLGNTMLVMGAGLLTGMLWLVLAGPLAAALVQKLAIEREERHLAARFGTAWKAYAANTPRWLLFR